MKINLIRVESSTSQEIEIGKIYYNGTNGFFAEFERIFGLNSGKEFPDFSVNLVMKEELL